MLKKSRIWRVLLLLVVIVMVSLYSGCVHKYYPSDDSYKYQTKEGAQIKEQEKQIKALQKEMEEMKEQK